MKNDDAQGISPVEFIQTLFGGVSQGFCEVTYLAPEGVNLWPHAVVQWAELPLGELDPELPNVMEKNRAGYGCYVGVAVRGRKYEPEQHISEKTGRPYTKYPRGKALDASYITALWVDIDEPGEAGYLRAIGQLTAPPSIVVSTGGGFHAYWLLTTPLPIDDDNRETVKRTLKGMAIAAGSDPKVAELARILRLPGTVNTKPGRGQRCEVIDFIPCTYDYMEFELTYAPLAKPAEPQITRHIPMEASAGLPKWVREYLDGGAPQGERNTRLYAAARELFDNGYGYSDVESMAGGRAALDGLPSEEIVTAIRSAYNAPRNTPNMPRHMAERMSAADHQLNKRSA